MQLQNILSYVRRAVQDYQMIETGDRIAVGISGGKDSLVLALALSHLKKFYPKSFELMAISVSLGFPEFDLSLVKAYFEELDIPFIVCETQIADIIFKERKETNPCSLCSKMRKGALYQTATKYECNKVALGHNKDDINESFLMSLFYEGRIHTMPPVNYMDQVNLHIIRPLIYLPETSIRGFAYKNALPVVKSPCSADGHTKRETTKQLISSLKEGFPRLDERLFGAIQRSQIEGWFQKEE